MRCVIALIGLLLLCAPCRAQSFPSSLVSNNDAVVCKDPEKLPDAASAHEKKDRRAFWRTGCRLLRGGMTVSVEFAQRVKTENYHLIRVTWRRGPSVWGYSYDFK